MYYLEKPSVEMQFDFGTASIDIGHA